ncbi:MAG: hypothetical protein KKE73_13295 [Proteobacteria bacterium]|nr:hypothetical protein [Pseudomonadota bacterium]
MASLDPDAFIRGEGFLGDVPESQSISDRKFVEGGIDSTEQGDFAKNVVLQPGRVQILLFDPGLDLCGPFCCQGAQKGCSEMVIT